MLNDSQKPYKMFLRQIYNFFLYTLFVKKIKHVNISLLNRDVSERQKTTHNLKIDIEGIT